MVTDSWTISPELADFYDRVLHLMTRLEVGTVLYRIALAERTGLSIAEYLSLELIIERDGLAGSQLAGITGLRSGSVSALAKRLERDGLIERFDDPRDGRRQILIATEEGRRLIGDVVERLQFHSHHRMRSELLYGLDDAARGVVPQFLSRAVDRVYRQGAALRLWQRGPSRWRSRGSTSRPAPTRSAPG
ncbi:MAG: MarR family transcriptional regulator [Pseudonocardia sediminis]